MIKPRPTYFLFAAILLFTIGRPSVGLGDEPITPQAGPVTPPPVTPAAPAPAPYSSPWGLRSAVPGNVARLDTTLGMYQDPTGAFGAATVLMPLLGLKLGSSFQVVARLGVVELAPPALSASTSFINPALGGMYSLRLGRPFRLSFFLGTTLPVGMGGDKTKSPGAAAANAAGILARSALDNSMFAVNDASVIPGLDLAYIDHRLTVQGEATLFQLFRVRNAGADPDAYKTNFTTGLHVGYFALSWLSLGGELRYQRYLSTPAAVAKDEAKRQNLSIAVGPRFHMRTTSRGWFRPGISYETGLLGPMSDQHYQIVKLDLPVSF